MPHDRAPSFSLCVLAALILPLGAFAEGIRLGSELQVNTYTTSWQRSPAVAVDAEGDFVIAWQSNGPDGSGSGIFASRFSSAGASLASEFRVNSYTAGYQYHPSVAVDADGDFVVAWSGVQDQSGYGVSASRFSSAGALLASEFQVNDFTVSQQRFPSVATDADGDFVVVWESLTVDGSLQGIGARRFSSAGVSLAPEFLVNTFTDNYQRYPSVAAAASGDFVVAWHSNGQDGSSWGIFARRFSSAGAALASEFQVNSYTANAQVFPSVAASASGDFVVAWSDNTLDGSSYGIFARRFSSAGAALGSEFQVNSYTFSYQRLPRVAMDAEGDFVVAWLTIGQDGSDHGIFARSFSSAGVPLTNDFQVNLFTTGSQRSPSVAASASGNFIVAWHSFAQDGDSDGVFAQRFAGPIILDIDDNGGVGALTDGLLVLRRFFGFSGTTLTTGAVDLVGCQRCDAAAIQSYLTGLGLVLDIDGNGSLGALTDGLLALRYMFGFTGATLTTGAIGGGCSRCDAPSIEPYLAGLT